MRHGVIARQYTVPLVLKCPQWLYLFQLNSEQSKYSEYAKKRKRWSEICGTFSCLVCASVTARVMKKKDTTGCRRCWLINTVNLQDHSTHKNNKGLYPKKDKKPHSFMKTLQIPETLFYTNSDNGGFQPLFLFTHWFGSRKGQSAVHTHRHVMETCAAPVRAALRASSPSFSMSLHKPSVINPETSSRLKRNEHVCVSTTPAPEHQSPRGRANTPVKEHLMWQQCVLAFIVYEQAAHTRLRPRRRVL